MFEEYKFDLFYYKDLTFCILVFYFLIKKKNYIYRYNIYLFITFYQYYIKIYINNNIIYLFNI